MKTQTLDSNLCKPLGEHLWKTLVFALLATAVVSQAQAQEEGSLPPGPYKCNSKDFKKAALNGIQRAIDNGWQKVGDLPLSEAQLEIAKSKAKVVCTDKKLNITDGRWSARFDTTPGAKRIEARKDNFEPAPKDIQENFAVHEFTQVEGNRDLNYDFSLRVLQMGERKFDPKSPLNDDPITMHKFPKGNSIKKSGGSTGVGGGGDVLDMHTRRRLLDAILTGIENSKLSERAMLRARKMYNLAVGIDIHFLLDQGIMDAPKIVRGAYTSLNEGDGALGVSVGRAWLFANGEDGVLALLNKISEVLNLYHADLIKAEIAAGEKVPNGDLQSLRFHQTAK